MTKKTEQQFSKPVQLDDPIQRGEQIIGEITLRKPRAGELRGVALMDLANLDVIALQRVLPRISNPTLTEQDISNMQPGDLLALGAEIAGFFERKVDRSPTA